MTESRRRLPFLGAALIVESLIAFLPGMSQQPMRGPIELGFWEGLIHPVTSIFLCLLGIETLILGLRKAVLPKFFGLAGSSVLILVVFQISYSLQSVFVYRMASLFLLFQSPSAVLLSVGATLVWGSAIARRELPGNGSCQKIGRIGGGLIQLGLVIAFVQEVLSSSRMGFRGLGSQGSASYGLFMLVRIAGRLLLLWCSVESVRGAMDEAVILLRARRIHKLMAAWIGVMTFSAVLPTLWWLQSPSVTQASVTRYNAWRGAVNVTISLIAAFAIAKQLMASNEGYKSASAAHPSGGAET